MNPSTRIFETRILKIKKLESYYDKYKTDLIIEPVFPPSIIDYTRINSTYVYKEILDLLDVSVGNSCIYIVSEYLNTNIKGTRLSIIHGNSDKVYSKLNDIAKYGDLISLYHSKDILPIQSNLNLFKIPYTNPLMQRLNSPSGQAGWRFMFSEDISQLLKIKDLLMLFTEVDELNPYDKYFRVAHDKLSLLFLFDQSYNFKVLSNDEKSPRNHNIIDLRPEKFYIILFCSSLESAYEMSYSKNYVTKLGQRQHNNHDMFPYSRDNSNLAAHILSLSSSKLMDLDLNKNDNIKKPVPTFYDAFSTSLRSLDLNNIMNNYNKSPKEYVSKFEEKEVKTFIANPYLKIVRHDLPKLPVDELLTVYLRSGNPFIVKKISADELKIFNYEMEPETDAIDFSEFISLLVSDGFNFFFYQHT